MCVFQNRKCFVISATLPQICQAGADRVVATEVPEIRDFMRSNFQTRSKSICQLQKTSIRFVASILFLEKSQLNCDSSVDLFIYRCLDRQEVPNPNDVVPGGPASISAKSVSSFQPGF